MQNSAVAEPKSRFPKIGVFIVANNAGLFDIHNNPALSIGAEIVVFAARDRTKPLITPRDAGIGTDASGSAGAGRPIFASFELVLQSTGVTPASRLKSKKTITLRSNNG